MINMIHHKAMNARDAMKTVQNIISKKMAQTCPYTHE